MRKSALLCSMVTLSLALGLGACHDMSKEGNMHHDMHMWTGVTHAIAVLQPTQGNSISGTLKFDQMANGVHISGQIEHLAPNSTHGFHIHEFGDVSSADGAAAGGHYNPDGSSHMHAGMDNPMRHAGDLGNIQADAGGVAHIDITDPDLSIAGMSHPIIGRSIVVHAGADDLRTQPSGASGARIAVGVIGIAK